MQTSNNHSELMRQKALATPDLEQSFYLEMYKENRNSAVRALYLFINIIVVLTAALIAAKAVNPADIAKSIFPGNMLLAIIIITAAVIVALAVYCKVQVQYVRAVEFSAQKLREIRRLETHEAKALALDDANIRLYKWRITYGPVISLSCIHAWFWANSVGAYLEF